MIPLLVSACLAVTPQWGIYRDISNQSLSSIPTSIQYNSKIFDTQNSCDITTGLCTPNKPGKYYISCTAQINSSTGPVVNGLLGALGIWVNEGTTYARVRTLAEVSSLSDPDVDMTTSAIVTLNGYSDTVGCSSYSGGTSPTISKGINVTDMFGFWIGP